MPHYEQSQAIRRVFTKGQPISLGKRQVIIGNDSEPDGVYYINTGYVELYSINDNGDHNIRLILGPGEILPITWAYLGTHNDTLFYETLAESLLWRMSREWFQDLIKSNLDISNAMAMQLAQQMNIFDNRVENLEYRKGRERVIYRLLFLASRFGIRDKDMIKIEAPITHEIFASTINMARESVSRELEKLEKLGLVERSHHVICILDVETLASKLSRPIDLAEWRLI